MRSKKKKIIDHSVYIKTFTKAHAGKDIMPEVTVPKQRKKKIVGQSVARGKYNRQEDKDKPEIMKRMRQDGWECWIIEPVGRYGKKGFGWGDLWLHHKWLRLMGWGEVKSMAGRLSDKQEQRQKECKECGINYWIIRVEGEGYILESEPKGRL